MINKYIKKNISIVDNSEKAHRAFLISGDPYIFRLKLGNSFIKHIQLYFKIYGQDSFNFNIDLFLNRKKHKRYSIPSKSLKSDSFSKLIVNEKIENDTELTIIISTPKNCENLYIWVNDKGPCIKIEGDSYLEYDFKRDLLFSIIMPVYKTKVNLLKRTIKSVIEQVYTNWELCIVDDGSNKKTLTNYLKNIKDKRIKIKINTKNKGIVSSSNDALMMAKGKYVGFLDHDDLLSNLALFKVAMEIDNHPSTDLVYTDEDKIFEDNSFGGPFYKSDWNYNLLLSSMYTCHFSVYRKKIIDEIEGFREGYDGSQDYDLVLRFVEKTKNIRHIPEILYHWRITEDSTAKSIMNKPDARINAVRAITSHLKRLGRSAIVAAGPHQGHYDVRYQLDEEPSITIVIPFKDNVDLLKNLLETITITNYNNYRVLLIDNNSKEYKTSSYLKKIVNFRVSCIKYKAEFNFSKIVNHALYEKVHTDYVLLLNNDIEIMHPEWLTRMVSEFARPEVSVVGAKLLYLDHRIQHAGVFVGINGIAGHSHKFMWDWDPGYFSRPHLSQDITAVTGACMLLKTEDFYEVKGFDESLPTAFNDIDYCLKLKKIGKSIVYTPYAKLYHRESASRGLDLLSDQNFIDSIKFMEDKWNISSFKDPFYNPNLPNNCEGRPWV
jgi:O-antigen biosynthesis protein